MEGMHLIFESFSHARMELLIIAYYLRIVEFSIFPYCLSGFASHDTGVVCESHWIFPDGY